jgi:DMSO/TMAO reductase YedYZ molybdopterin-dependent catalytic subunit
LRSLRERYTSAEDFYVRDHLVPPAGVEAATLRIESEAENPREFAPADLAMLRERRFGAVLECAGDRVASTGLVSNGAWAGWSLKNVLMMARPTDAAAHFHLLGRDSYKRSVPLEQALADGILVTRLNSCPLTLRHAAPWRGLPPGWYGMDSVKYLERIVVATASLPPEGGTYQQTPQTLSGELDRQLLPRVQVKSVIVDPRQGQSCGEGERKFVASPRRGWGRLPPLR